MENIRKILEKKREESRKLNWSKLHGGKISQEEIKRYIPQEDWQEHRKKVKGNPLDIQYQLLKDWLDKNKWNRASIVQVTNYINALARGGLIDPIK